MRKEWLRCSNYQGDKNMKKRYLLMSVLVYMLFSSCETQGVIASYGIQLYNENNVLIVHKNELKDFDVSFFDNSKTKPYRSVEIFIAYYGKKEGKDYYQYQLHFHMGMSAYDYVLTNYLNRFKDAREYMGIKIEDKKGRYKPVTIYPLSACDRVQGFEPIVVKLEKK